MAVPEIVVSNQMASAEEIIEKILSENPQLSKEELMKMLEGERKRTGGFISDEILLQMIAAGLGVEVSSGSAKPKLLIGNLVPGLNDVTVVGRVVAVFPAKPSKKGKRVRIASVFVIDKSGILRVVLWNDKAAFTEPSRMEVGQIVRFLHGYTVEDRWGKVELHMGERSEVEVNPQDVEPEEYPTIEVFSTKIGEITSLHKNKRIHVLGEVGDFYPPSTFKRQDHSAGKVMRLVLKDETGKIPVVVWNDKVDDVESFIRRGVKLQIVNAKVKEAANEGLEVHVDGRTYVGLLKPANGLSKIGYLKEGLRNVNVQGRVVVRPVFREVKTSKGELVKLAVFEIEDETGKIWVSAWRKNSEMVVNLKVGDRVVVKNAYVRRGFGDKLEISTVNTSSIEILHD